MGPGGQQNMVQNQSNLACWAMLNLRSRFKGSAVNWSRAVSNAAVWLDDFSGVNWSQRFSVEETTPWEMTSSTYRLWVAQIFGIWLVLIINLPANGMNAQLLMKERRWLDRHRAVGHNGSLNRASCRNAPLAPGCYYPAVSCSFS